MGNTQGKAAVFGLLHNAGLKIPASPGSDISRGIWEEFGAENRIFPNGGYRNRAGQMILNNGKECCYITM